MSATGMNPKDRVGAKKAPLGLVPPALALGAAEALANGAEKYGPYNWREYPVEVMTYVEAAERHLAAFRDGQDNAEDTGIHHLKHVVAGLGILLDSLALGIAVDNRPPKGPAADLLRALDLSAKGIPTSNETLLELAGITEADRDAALERWSAYVRDIASKPLPLILRPAYPVLTARQAAGIDPAPGDPDYVKPEPFGTGFECGDSCSGCDKSCVEAVLAADRDPEDCYRDLGGEG